MVSVNTNIASLQSQSALAGTKGEFENSMLRLSTGKRINGAADDAAGLSIANSMTAQIKGLKMASKNASDGISLANTVEGALQETTDILQRMRELAVQATSDTNSGNDRVFIQDEINQLNNEVNRVANDTEFNGIKVLNGTFSDKTLQVGNLGGQTIAFGVENADNATLGAFQKSSAIESTRHDSATSAAATLDAALTATADYTVNVSGSTGITASLTTDKSGINLVQEEGYDIIFGDMAGGTAFYQSMDRNETLDTTGGAQTLLSGSTDSGALLGQVTLSSHQAFTITPGVNTNHFSAATAEISSSRSSIAGVSLSTKSGATNSLAVIDGALAMISEIRSSMGAANNRLKSTVDNLSNIAVNAQSSLSKIEDANFAEETSALTKAQILQQASTAMLAQANKGKQGMLQLIQGL